MLRISLREEVTGTWSWKMRSGRAVVEGGVVGVGVPGLAMGGIDDELPLRWEERRGSSCRDSLRRWRPGVGQRVRRESLR